MKSALWGAGLLALVGASPALAADLPVKAAPVASVYDWTGFYIGGNATIIHADKRWDYLGPLLPTGPDGNQRIDGAFGGVQAGFDYQVGSWVLGLSAQGDWGEARGSAASLLFPGVQTNRSLINAFGLFGGRLGYALNNVLFYGKGGVGGVHDKYDVFDTGTGLTLATASETRFGPSAGFGFELAFSEHVSIAGEYNHVFLGRRDLVFSTGDIYRIRQDLDVFAVHLNYRFNGR
ncbi:MAG: porin family protein [Rhodopseudomonas sp.]|uniref:outer membrane protein n=1 Tax=Rhodopseudomonas sp. TaxID=1078 RepID=UPI001856428D|nr:outer membrane beta-barrel protein [Rhodopseudomonas sp.]NVN87756.1 porin family protein [Rhodopseudomonas sp.]